MSTAHGRCSLLHRSASNSPTCRSKDRKCTCPYHPHRHHVLHMSHLVSRRCCTHLCNSLAHTSHRIGHCTAYHRCSHQQYCHLLDHICHDCCMSPRLGRSAS